MGVTDKTIIDAVIKERDLLKLVLEDRISLIKEWKPKVAGAEQQKKELEDRISILNRWLAAEENKKVDFEQSEIPF